jgi:predicted transcriptional regulator
MSAQTYATSHADVDGRSVPDGLSSAETKLVYLYLSVADEATIDDLNDDLGVTKLSLFPALDNLDSRGLVTREGERYRIAS